MRKSIKKIAAAIMTLALLVGCGGTQAATVQASEGGEKIVTVANTAAWEALHPLSSNRDLHVAFMYPIYESWVTITSEGEILPRLFESWEQSEDGTKLTCHLNQSAKWSDGEPITAHDIVFTMELVSNPDVPISTRVVVGTFAGTDATGTRIEGEELGVKALDDYTVEFTYKEEKVSTLLNELYTLRYTFTLPEHCLKDIPAESILTDPFWENPVTSGAFTIDNIISGERIEYVARDDYYLGRPQMDRLVIRVISPDNLLSAMLAGEVDTCTYGSAMSYGDYELAKNDPSLTTFEAPGFGNNHLLINNENMDQNARLAMDCAIDKEGIINDVLFGYARPAISAIVPENPYRNENVTGNPYDVELAKEYMAKSSYDTSRPVRLIISSANTLGQQVGVLLQQQLAEIGLNVTIETYDSTSINSMLFAGDYDISLGQSASNPFEPSESDFYFQEGDLGWLRLSDGSWFELYAQGMAGMTLEERKPYYDQLQERLVAEVPMIYLYHADVLFASSQKISGMDYESFALKSWRYEEWDVK